MDSYSGSEPRKFISFHFGKEKTAQPTREPESTEMTTNPVQSGVEEAHELIPAVPPTEQTETMDLESLRLNRSPSQSLISLFFATDSSGSNENCGIYNTCKTSQVEEAAAKYFTELTDQAQRESISEPIEITPCIQQNGYGVCKEPAFPKLCFLIQQ